MPLCQRNDAKWHTPTVVGREMRPRRSKNTAHRVCQNFRLREWLSGPRRQPPSSRCENPLYSSEVIIRRDPRSGEVILSEIPALDEVFAALDAAKLPLDIVSKADSDRRPPEDRPKLSRLFEDAHETKERRCRSGICWTLIHSANIVFGRSQAARAEFRRLHADADAEHCISVFTEAEVRVGIANHALSPSQRSAIEGLFANLEILPWGSAEAQIYGEARAKLQAKEIGFSQIYLLI